jgi:CRISPR/Cas system-associated exonuclease Cas4 (RecB family)
VKLKTPKEDAMNNGTKTKQYISASKIAQFLYCPFTFELAEAGYEPVEPYLPAVASGIAMHTAFRYMWEGRPADKAAETAIAVTEITMGHEIDKKERETLLRRLKAIPKWLLNADQVEVKVEKEIPNTDIVITGYIDAIVGDKVVDLKAVNKMKPELPPTYQIQGQIYMYAYDKPMASFVMIGPKGEVVEYEINRLPDETIGQMLEYFAYSMAQGYRPPSGLTNFACNKCAFQHVCPFYNLLKQTKNTYYYEDAEQ